MYHYPLRNAPLKLITNINQFLMKLALKMKIMKTKKMENTFTIINIIRPIFEGKEFEIMRCYFYFSFFSMKKSGVSNISWRREA